MIASNINAVTLRRAAEAIGVQVVVNSTSGTHRRHRVKVNAGDWKDEDGNRKYQRISASAFGSERRVAAVCWHGFRDFFRFCFELEPDAVFRTAFDTWDGSKDFEARYRWSAHHNVGSQAYPKSACEVCRCPESGLAQ